MSGVQSVERAFSLLVAVAERPSSLTELANRVGLPISTASRLLSTLEGLGAVERVDEAGVYRIGASIITMASSMDSSASLAALARPVLERLAVDAGEAVLLGVPSSYAIHFVEQVEAARSVQVREWVGQRLPMHLTSAGIAVLANWPADAAEAFLQRPLPATTNRSIVDAERIRARLRQAREDGFAWTHEELEPGITSVSAPVLTSQGDVIGAVNVYGPSFRFPGKDHMRFERLVTAAATEISAFVGTG